VASAALILSLTAASPASSGVPPPSAAVVTERSATRWVVTVGDSFLSGEGGRWAGNITSRKPPLNYERVDALGPDAYHDGFGRERIPGCHRSESAPAYVRLPRLRGKNLACSSATTRSQRGSDPFKPGLDFYRDKEGNVGQLVLLRRFASDHRVSDVVVSIGGNDYDFEPIVTHCAEKFVATSGTLHDICADDPQVRRHFTRENVERVTTRITRALLRVRTAMKRAGYGLRDYEIVVQNYPSPLPPGRKIRYAENQVRRGAVGGCPFFDEDADAAQSLMLDTINGSVRRAMRRTDLPNIQLMDLSRAYVGSRLCERGAHQIQGTDLATWRERGAVNKLEWVNMVYVPPMHPAPWHIKESIHPNYWGQLAMRSCVRQAVAGKGAHGGMCLQVAPGLSDRDEPRMRLFRR